MPLADPHQPWLNSRRLTAQGLCLALGLWCIYAWVMATPGLRDRNGLIKGTDFQHFYTLGLLARAHRGADLYNMPEQTRLLTERVPAAGRAVYLPLYGPQVSIFFAPFAALSYGAALTAWLLCSTFLYAVCVYAVWKTCPHLRPNGATVFWIAAAYPAFFNLILWGQSSAPALVCFAAAYLFLRQQQLFAAGLALGCLVFKPQLGLVVAFVFFLTGAWRLIAGALITSAAQLLSAWTYYGTAVLDDYAVHMLHVGKVLGLLEPRIVQTHCLRTFWKMLIPWPPLAWGLYAACAAVVLWLTFHCWRSTLPLSLRYSVLLLATVLVSPHLTVYDLVILAPALLLLADWILGLAWNSTSRCAVILLYLVYLLPLVGFLARWTHIQFSVVAMSILLWMICRTKWQQLPQQQNAAV